MTMRYHKLTIALAILLALSACSMEVFRKKGPMQVSGEPESLRYAEQLQVNLKDMTRTPSGLYIEEVVEGTGPAAAAGNTVSVGYRGSLVDGTEFDRSRPGDPIRFVLGRRQVIDGWEEGISGMKVGGKRLLVIPPRLGYGAAGAPGAIPPNATLVFEVTLEAITP